MSQKGKEVKNNDSEKGMGEHKTGREGSREGAKRKGPGTRGVRREGNGGEGDGRRRRAVAKGEGARDVLHNCIMRG